MPPPSLLLPLVSSSKGFSYLKRERDRDRERERERERGKEGRMGVGSAEGEGDSHTSKADYLKEISNLLFSVRKS